MLKIQAFAVQTLKTMAPMVAAIAAKDPDLGRQLRRAASSIVLNLAEAQTMRDGNSRQRFRTALGSARETHAALEVGVAWGYVRRDGAVEDALDRIEATLNKLAR
jgi:four helix bundle protein